MSDKQQTVEVSPEAQAEFGQANRAVELSQARAEAAMANLRAAEAQRFSVALKEMAAQGLKPAEWNPTAMPEGVLSFVKVESKASAAAVK
jgi:hypothetical protein